MSNQTLCLRFFKVLRVTKVKLAESHHHNGIMLCWTTFLPLWNWGVRLLTCFSTPTFPSDMQEFHSKPALCFSTAKQQFLQWPVKHQRLLYEMRNADYGYIYNLLSSHHPKEKYEKYRFIAFLGSQSRIICDYTLYSYLQAGISKKMCFFFWKEEKVQL